jgi:SAM-dependent methyltransferase
MIYGDMILGRDEIYEKDVLEVGSLNVNGSLRKCVMKRRPASYIGIDIRSGLGVDRVLAADHLVDNFGSRSFDLVICTETLEHIREWKWAVHQMKGVLRDGGILLLTTRSPGFPLHEYPGDYWRFRMAEIHEMMLDMEILDYRRDEEEPGVFVKARKPREWCIDALSPPDYPHVLSVQDAEDVAEVANWTLKMTMVPPVADENVELRRSAMRLLGLPSEE